MPAQSKGLHHMNIRKRIHKKHEKYPHPDKFKRNYDKLMYAVAIICPLITLPQLLKIWVYQDATGVSALSWLGFSIISVLWMYYGILHKEKPLIVMNIAFATMQLLTAIGAIRY